MTVASRSPFSLIQLEVKNLCDVNRHGAVLSRMLLDRPVFTHGPPGPGPRAANFQGRHIKKIEIDVWYAEKKGCPRERNLREIYTENNVGTEFSRYDATGASRS